MFRPKTFGEAIRPILILNILYGTGSFVLSKEQKVRNIVESVYMAIAWISFNSIFFMQFIFNRYIVMTNINMSFTLIMSWVVISYEMATVLIFITKFKMKSTQDLIDSVDNIDEKMLTIGLPKQYLTHYKQQIYHFVAWLAHITSAIAVTWFYRVEPNAPIVAKIGISFGANHIQIMLMTVQLSFILWIGHIRTRFRQLNNLLEEMIETLDPSGPKRFLDISDCRVHKRRRPNVHVLQGNIETIMKAKNYHLDLIKIARRINKFYGKQLLVTTFGWCLSIMTLLYMFNFCIWSPLSGPDLVQVLMPVIMGIMVITSRMIHLHSNCMEITNEARKAGFLLCRLYNSSTSITFRAEVQHFTRQVIANPLVFTVCGLVEIDRTFISSVMGSIFAYLVVIIQLASPQAQNRHNLAANVTDMNATVSYTRSFNLSTST